MEQRCTKVQVNGGRVSTKRYWWFKFLFFALIEGSKICPLSHLQCDQMARFFINIWPFTTFQKFQKPSNIAQVG